MGKVLHVCEEMVEATSKIYKGAIEPVDNIPLVEVTDIEKKEQLKARLFVELEYLNPAGGVKDRVGKAMIEDTEHTGRLRSGSVIVESTSDNVGIGLATVPAVKGYRVILTMPGTIGAERRNIPKAYEAETVLTSGEEGVSGVIEKAGELAKEIPDSFVSGQFNNPVNPRAHMESTGPEVWQDTDKRVDIFVAPVGTGGTLTGTGIHLKKKNPRIGVTAVEPPVLAVLSGGSTGPHKIQGTRAGSIPRVLNTRAYNEIATMGNEAPFVTVKMLTRTERLLTGIPLRAVLYARIEVARRPENKGKTIAVPPLDNEDRYYSTVLSAE